MNATSELLNRPHPTKAQAALAMIDRAETYLEWAEASNSLPHHSFGEAERLLRSAAVLLCDTLAFQVRVAAEHCVVARETFPSGASAIPYVRAVRAAVERAGR